jgi:hypothetical protein
MIEVVNDGTSVNKFAIASEVIKPVAQIRILASPTGEAFVIPVHRDEIIAPDPEVAARSAPRTKSFYLSVVRARNMKPID